MMKILNWFKRHWILSIFLLVTGVPAGLNYSGFCIEQGRWLSDEEFLLAIAEHASEGKILQNIKAEKGQITKDDIRKFLKENPECCRLYRGSVGMESYGAFIDFFNRINGFPYASADVEYELSDLEAKRRQEHIGIYYRRYLSINTCGNVSRSFGETIEKQYTRYKNK